jgi:hypothetical protein
MKAQINSLIIIIFLMGAMNSSTKFGKNITIEGRVENPITGEGISGAEIWLLKTTMGLPGADKEIKTAISDANGNFELNKFSFRADKIRMGDAHGDYYTIGWHKDGEYVSTNSTLEIKKGKKLYVDFHMVPYGEYRIRINNINCQGINDTIIINQTNQFNNFLGLDWTLKGCSGYTTAWDKVPMGTIHTKYTVIRGGISNTYEEDFVVEPNQQNEQVIDY